MNPDIERVQQYLAISQKVSAPEKQHEKRKPKKQNQHQSFEEVPSLEEEQSFDSDFGTTTDSDNHLDITT